MRATTLPSPGPIAGGHQIRQQAAMAISRVQMLANHTGGGKAKTAKQLSDFFAACVTALAGYIDATAPTVTTRVRTATNTAVITFNETLGAVTPPLTAFVFTPARTVTNVVVSGTTVTITATGVIVGDSVAYTQPGTAAKLQDRYGNLVANFSGVLA